MYIDSHQHFWTYNNSDYVWMTGPLNVLARDFQPDDLRPCLDNLAFQGTVAVQARQMTEESDFLLDLASRYPWIYGVVGWVDFESPDLPESLDRLASNPKMVGVRELIHDMSDDDYAAEEPHLGGIGLLEERSLTYDLLLRPRHIPAAIRLVDAYPNQRFVVDHIGKPDIKGGEIEPWKGLLQDLSRRDNVFCKLSGMVTEADWQTWTPEELVPYLEIVLEAFGPFRLMIGSDWPVCTCAGPYESVMGASIRYLDSLGESERKAVLGGTCADFYNLTIPLS